MGNFTFAQVPRVEIPRSSFNRTHGHKTTFDAGYLIPFLVDEALPGDTFVVDATLFARLATPIFPMMDTMYLDVFYFAVPNRLLWENWERMMGSQDNPDDPIDFLVPIVDMGASSSFPENSIFDYMGMPINVHAIEVSALWLRAYNLIWNTWFRDENLQDAVAFNLSDGPDAISSYGLLRRGKRHDYFTSCLPWPQKGPGVELPLGTSAPVQFTLGTPEFMVGAAGPYTLTQSDDTGTAASGKKIRTTTGADDGVLSWHDLGATAITDLSSATAATINSLREAFQIQRLLERDARGGTRYIEILRSHFGVVSPDARLQRPEFLGGGSVPVIVNPVTQTSQTSTTPQGNLAAYGVARGGNMGFTKSFVEHCVIIGLVSARAELTYQQGLHRMFSRRTRYDFYWPAFAHLGEQAVLNREIYCDGTNADAQVFGYQERWAEYRYFPSKVTGQFRSANTASLDTWHLAQEFAALPTLNDTFIVENPPVDRVIAVPSAPHFLFDSHIRMRCTRPMPTYSVPGLMDHF